MCIFRLHYRGKYLCGKRYPLECSPSACPYGPLYDYLVRDDFKSDRVWVMPANNLVSVEEAVEALRAGIAEYAVKSIVMPVGKNRRRRG